MPDYLNGLIYKITTPNGLYVGSSCDFKRREWEHRGSLHNKNCKSYNIKLYQNIRENSGVWEMKKIKDFPCNSKRELEKEEDRIILELNSNMNERRAYTTVEEAKEKRKANKEQINKQRKEHRQANKEQYKQRDKQYREANKEQCKQRDKKYYQANKERNREKVECECGCKITRDNIINHRKTKKHLNLMSNK